MDKREQLENLLKGKTQPPQQVMAIATVWGDTVNFTHTYFDLLGQYQVKEISTNLEGLEALKKEHPNLLISEMSNDLDYFINMEKELLEQWK